MENSNQIAEFRNNLPPNQDVIFIDEVVYVREKKKKKRLWFGKKKRDVPELMNRADAKEQGSNIEVVGVTKTAYHMQAPPPINTAASSVTIEEVDDDHSYYS